MIIFFRTAYIPNLSKPKRQLKMVQVYAFQTSALFLASDCHAGMTLSVCIPIALLISSIPGFRTGKTTFTEQ